MNTEPTMTLDQALQVAELVSPMPQLAHEALQVLVAALNDANRAAKPTADTITRLTESHRSTVNEVMKSMDEELRAIGDVKALQCFAAASMGSFFAGCDLPHPDLQSYAVEVGLLRPEMMPAPCGDDCACADLGLAFPALCYRGTPMLERCRAALKRKPTHD